jgi:hypothetical protein
MPGKIGQEIETAAQKSQCRSSAMNGVKAQSSPDTAAISLMKREVFKAQVSIEKNMRLEGGRNIRRVVTQAVNILASYTQACTQKPR